MLTLISLVHAYVRSPPYKKTLLIGFIDFRYFGLLGTGRREGSYKKTRLLFKTLDCCISIRHGSVS